MHDHPTSHSHLYDVIIAGAGPVGLLLACECRLHGLSVLLMERAADPASIWKQLPFGMRGLSVPTVDALDRRGLLAGLVDAAAHATGQPAAHWLQQRRRPAGHFAGIQFHLDRVDPRQWPYRLPDSAAAHMAVSMQALETVLSHRAVAIGVDIRRGCGVDHFTVDDDVVTVHAGSHRMRGSWLVGCDGGRSVVRKVAGIEFAGTEPEFTGYSVQAELADPDALRPGRHVTPGGMITYTHPGTIAMVEFDAGAGHRQVPLTREYLQQVLRRVACQPLVLCGVTHASTWSDRARQATAYRSGRVLLAGDAAHVHSPLGGQGLNLGLADALNLGWKLAATVRGTAPDDLLDSYHRERHPAGARILDWSRAQVALMRPDPGTRALAAIVGDLMEMPDGATYFARRMWGVDLRYELGDAHPLGGRSVPDFALDHGARLGPLLRTGRGLLLEFDGAASLRTLAGRWAPQLCHVTVQAGNPMGVRALLVRPDGVVAWACDGEVDMPPLVQALSRWFGLAGGGGDAV
ncbi:FAD-dependent monooxygenase [Herbaspirillum sp. YR522]|uniref:FAD-dependent monooxygenase n=1 Tax=Herbaspirillum sp. YR522 TaxID=1144342 RepID=UPI00026F7736|nr:FAD-dependent monooxygenase [Herbaspirillum sp. YR522]EJM96383.1 2-polyprenyl-6-methoxyphenol hydroxylase-like oxidoreductase [Herbaspirillum sp. YR522]